MIAILNKLYIICLQEQLKRTYVERPIDADCFLYDADGPHNTTAQRMQWKKFDRRTARGATRRRTRYTCRAAYLCVCDHVRTRNVRKWSWGCDRNGNSHTHTHTNLSVAHARADDRAAAERTPMAASAAAARWSLMSLFTTHTQCRLMHYLHTTHIRVRTINIAIASEI